MRAQAGNEATDDGPVDRGPRLRAISQLRATAVEPRPGRPVTQLPLTRRLPLQGLFRNAGLPRNAVRMGRRLPWVGNRIPKVAVSRRSTLDDGQYWIHRSASIAGRAAEVSSVAGIGHGSRRTRSSLPWDSIGHHLLIANHWPLTRDDPIYLGRGANRFPL